VLPKNRIAFKEWAAVCAALADGRQTLILRKGGIHEGPDGFRPEHGEFWLFPTYLHEAPDAVVDEAHELLDRVQRDQPPPEIARLGLYAVVQGVIELNELEQVYSLAGQHIWSPRTVASRFHYRRPGLFLLLVRVHRLANPVELPNSPHFAGCRTWVEFPCDIPTTGAEPVLSDAAFARACEQMREAVASVRTA
jgi:hypothetical protein